MTLPSQLQEIVQELEQFHVPSSNPNNNSNDDGVDPALVEQYQTLRNVYLHRGLINTFLTRVQQSVQVVTDENDSHGKSQVLVTKPESSSSSSVETAAAAAAAWDDLQRSVREVQHSQLQVQASLAGFCEKRQQLQQMMREAQQQTEEDNEDDDMMEDDDDTMDEESIDERAAAEQEDKLASLQQRRAALEAEMRAVQRQHLHEQERVQQQRVEFHKMQQQQQQQVLLLQEQAFADDETSSSPTATVTAKLRHENEALQSRTEELEQAHEFYDSLVQMVQDLGGIRILSVVEAANAAATTDDDTDDNFALVVEKPPPPPKELALTVLIAQQHKVQLRLCPAEASKRRRGSTPVQQQLQVLDAKFLTPTVLYSSKNHPTTTSTAGTGEQEKPMEQQHQQPAVQLRIPDLTNLVQAAHHYHRLGVPLSSSSTSSSGGGDPLRFVLRETRRRIVTLQARVHALAELQQAVGASNTQIYPIPSAAAQAGDNNDNDTNSWGADEQEVVCRLPQHGVRVFLRLTPDCPLAMGSVYIGQLVVAAPPSTQPGSNDHDCYDPAVLEQVQAAVNHGTTLSQHNFKRPLEVIRAVQDQLQEHRRVGRRGGSGGSGGGSSK